MAESKIDRKIMQFAEKHDLICEWQGMRHGGRRLAILTMCYKDHEEILKAAKRLKGVSVTDWTIFDGEFEGKIYLQDQAEYDRIQALNELEMERNNNWWAANALARGMGMSSTAAAKYAETLFPTP